MKKILCGIIRFVGFGLTAILMIPAAMLITAIRYISEFSDKFSETPERREQ